jgi:archaetidylinositol phosphate synthase
MAGFQASGQHVRQHDSVLAAAEKRLLIWIAGRLPGWIHSDHLSALGAASMLVVAAGFVLAGARPEAGVPLVVGGLALNWFGDSLDGTVARVRNRLRPRYGFYLDHVLDIAGTTAMVAGMGASGLMSPLVAAAVLVAWLLVSAEAFLATHAVGRFKMATLGVGPTELRILLAIGALWLLRGAWVTPFGLPPVRLFDIGGVIGAVGLGGTFVLTAIRNTRALHAEETTW